MDAPLIVVLATRNEGKVEEFRRLVAGFPVALKGMEDYGAPMVEEDGRTFEENARKKACETSRAIGLPAMADDSGLEVTALGGRPGIRSARFAGVEASDQANNRKLLALMKGQTDRRARFVCLIAVASPDGAWRAFKGTCEGIILEEPLGDQGFGYDPVFYHPPSGKTFAQMSAEEKNRVSHRGKAMRELKEAFGVVLAWLAQWRQKGAV
jgi:XTP/dITP diphosphohydrolase